MAKNQIWFDKLTQILLPIFTVSGWLLVASKHAKYGFIVNSIGQIFWLYTSYQAYKRAGQVGIFVTTIIMTIVTFYGLFNWWLNP